MGNIDNNKIIKNIVIIANGYPTNEDPVYTFIRPVACEIADRGINCIVIAPQKILNSKKKRRKIEWNDYTSKGNAISILQPYFFSFGNVKLFGISLTFLILLKTIKKVFKNKNICPDAIYGHFWSNGLIAASLSQNGKIPVYVASGESRINIIKTLPAKMINELKRNIKAAIFVSTKNYEESKNLNLIDDNTPYLIAPNAIDEQKFYKYDKTNAREKLGFEKDTIIAIFVGTYSNRKGVLRVVEAAKDISNLKLVLIGSGEQEPKGDNIIFSGRVPHEEIVHYLNASDFFVLPTLAEGCSNAIIEAMGCGLPIISSNLPFNRDILNSDNSILIDPNNINEIREAMRRMCLDVDYRNELSKKSYIIAKKLTISSRVNKILNFIQIENSK